MVAALHAAGIKIIVDIVPNHSSDRHEWFRAALASPAGSPERDRYIFRDGLGDDGELPPSDWQSTFGGPAWAPVGDGQWYFHFFATQQPDLNWDNPEVRADFQKTLRFWADRGVAGFRVDVAHGLSKDLPAELPSQAEVEALDRSSGQHPLWDRDAVHEIYAEWRTVFDEYDPPRIAVAEAWVETPERRAKYATTAGLGQAFSFDLLEADFDADQFRTIITDNLTQAEATGSSSTWVFSNHDVVRHATRYGLPPVAGPEVKQGAEWLNAGGPRDQIDLEAGLRRARAATLLMLALPGSAYLYQGEELGLGEVAEIPDEQRQDPVFFRTTPDVRGRDGLGRDGCRVPIPWTRDGLSFGFGSAGAHLPQPAWFAEYSIEAEDGDPDSTLNLYRRALELRRELQTAETLDWIETESDAVLHFRRDNGWESLTNFGTDPVALPDGSVLIASGLVGDLASGRDDRLVAPAVPMTEPGAPDPDFPRHRVRPRAGWVNDPNGPIRWQDRWHVFFQYNPTAPTHKEICWGHASSADLVRWHDEPVALTPTPAGLDATGCWSGCVVDDGGTAVAVYTAVPGGPETALIALAHAEDDDLRRWRKSVVPAAEPPSGLDLLGFRDPFVFTYNGRRFGIIGAGAEPGSRGMVLLYACDDLAAWRYLGVLLDTTDAVAAVHAPADVWECPNLVHLDGRWVLLLSLVSGTHLGRVAYLVGDLEETAGALRFVPTTGGLVDNGHACYAPALLAAGDRTLLWGWVVEDRAESEVLAAGWAGALTVTRQLAHYRPAESSRSDRSLSSRRLQCESHQVRLASGTGMALPTGSLDILVHVNLQGEEQLVTLCVLAGIELDLDLDRGEATLRALPHTQPRRDWDTRGSFERDADRHEVRILIDGSIVEIFVANGPVFTQRSYADLDRRLALSADSETHADVVVRRLAPTDG